MEEMPLSTTPAQLKKERVKMLAPNDLYKNNFRTKKKLTRPFEGVLPEKYLEWNKLWKAPFGGIFKYQMNNVTRYYEYPWAFYAADIHKRMNVLDFGGGLCGFQFVLSKSGLNVHNVDPGLGSKGIGWRVNEKSIEKLNKKFQTNVKLHNCFIEEAKLASDFFNVVYSISVFEHLTGFELDQAMRHINRILKPGGVLVMTVDLFPNVYPFTTKIRNRWGKNVSIKRLVEMSGLKMVYGDKNELYGFKEFNKDKILEDLEKYFIGNNYPALIQTVILKKEV